ncbi:hypothetical protein PV10_06479 [Exophiala mesophila]|uniref:DJ-1/PfpI domain-containing protein n=1 Tax=Exophiala mesophila TaxID=212818 RepID=A0A0D1ZBF4_EXOME|nr:uncharacterized protein PV10_06479 [Exophiala mesophila]KIV91997.1 hypothetical protein PV10_06479 [Exophiala mesophila]
MPSLRIGVIYEEVQLCDIMGIDIIGSMGKDIISSMSSYGFSHLIDRAYDLEWLYISSTMAPAKTTPSIKIVPTHTYDTAPRDLDMIVVGGPLPSHRPEASLKFFREAVEKTKIIFSVCTGSMWLASSGILDGNKATTNRSFLPLAKQMHPEVEWLDQRWVVVDQADKGKAQLWIAGAADCGVEMIATYALENLDPVLAKLACSGIGFNPQNPQHGQFYSDAPAVKM